MSDADNFSFIQPKSPKAIGMNSSDESFTLNVVEDKPCLDLPSSFCDRMTKKKKKKKKKKFHEIRDEELLIEDFHMENPECSTFSDSPKKKCKRKRQHEDNTEEACDSHVPAHLACENADETPRSKKKKAKKEICEYSEDNDYFTINNLAVEEGIGKKKKKKHRDQNELTDDVYVKFSGDESCKTAIEQLFSSQANCSEEMTKKKKKKRKKSVVSIDDNVEPENDTIHISKKKQKSCDSTQITKNKVAKDDIEIVEKNCDVLKKKKRKSNVQTQEDDEKECDQEIQQNKRKKKHKKKYDECSSEYTIKYESLHSEYDEPSVEAKALLMKDECLDNEYDEPIVEAVLGSKDEDMEEQGPSVMENELKKGPRVQKKKKIESFDVNVKDLLEKSIDEEFLTEEQVVKLDNLEVELPFEVPPLHFIETQIIKALKPSEKAMIENLDLTVKTGAYNKGEDERIEKNWERFCELHNFNKEESHLFTRFKHRNAAPLSHEQRFKFLRFLAHGMPDRLLCSVYRRFQRNFRMKSQNLGRFTEAEDKIILDYMRTQTGQVYLELSHILKRNRLAINRRYKALMTEDVSVKWSDDLSIKLVNCLEKYCGVSKSELEHWDISLDEWKLVADKMQLPVAKLKRIWLYVVYVKLFIKDDTINSKEIRRELIKTVCESGANDWKAVNWAHLAKNYQGFTPEKICKIYKDTFEYHVPKGLQTDFKKGAVYLKKNVLKDSYGRLKGRTYRKLPVK